ncbi:MAG: valine--tRNA ligase [Candidatus Omnitrophota bacterium]|nr:valine--tRNA ligase [Candidatus Omnitrophota bacterium]
MNEIPKIYDSKQVEEKWYKIWEEKGFFQPKIDLSKKPFTVVIPPPNVTGILHIGHALNNILQDILIRWQRMNGVPALWVPGTDHAGIATQNVVEEKLRQKNLKRQDLGREKFLEEIWQWKTRHGGTIIEQLKKLGCSCDWSRERFTLDQGLSQAVQQAFIHLYNKGLIYRGSFIVNWCPRCQTALSNEEVQHEDKQGNLYYIRYPFKSVGQSSSQPAWTGRSADYVTVATTRPETMLGDTAVAVNPKDKRYKKFIGKKLILPVINKELEIIADQMVDPEFGTGAVKITPCHDPNDYEISLRHCLKGVVVMNPDGTMNSNAGKYQGMDRFGCREVLLADLKEKGLVEKVKLHQHSIGHCYRCHTMIEPFFSEQWFVKMKQLAQPAIQVVKQAKIKFYPGRWTKVYLNWMDNIKDWCISRQIWWGHRLPVWFCRDCYQKYLSRRLAKEIDLPLQISDKQAGIIVSQTKPSKCPKCGSVNLKQDEDVLDTWFSSWLWPFSTLGWPNDTEDLKYFYPTSVLVTGYEIIFFWVARMIMAGIEFTGRIPFEQIYIHGIVRDKTGTKMSKSLGNVVDPLDIIKEFGTDSLRFSIISSVAAGQDVFLSKERFIVGRNFSNKIWNAARFILINIGSLKQADPKLFSKTSFNLADKWILSRLNKTVKLVNGSLKNYRFSEAANVIYEFFWHEFCDWYLELVKPLDSKPEITRAVLCHVLEASMRLLHPFMPFITEEVWRKFSDQQGSIMTASWPEVNRGLLDDKAEADMGIIIDEITGLRNIRAEWNIPPSKKVDLVISTPVKYQSVLKNNSSWFKDLAGVGNLKIAAKIGRPDNTVTVVVKGIENYVVLKGAIDLKKEKKRLSKQIEEFNGRLNRIQGKLKNKSFISKAPKEIVKKQKLQEKDLSARLKIIKQHLSEVIGE